MTKKHFFNKRNNRLLNIKIVVMAEIIGTGIMKVIFDPHHVCGAILESVSKIPCKHPGTAKAAKNKKHMLSVIFPFFIAIFNPHAINNFHLL